mgnify:CR=1 FL=1
MRKVKINLRAGSTGKKFYLFPTAEALYVWLCALERGETVQVPDIQELVLEPDGFIEVELRGFEYSYEGNKRHRRLNLVRLGKAQQPKNASGLLVTTHTGWVACGLMPLHDYVDHDVESRVINDEQARLDLPTLFGDDD